MDLKPFYQARISEFSKRENEFREQENRLMWIRLAVFVAGIIGLVYFFQLSIVVGIVFSIVFIVSFGISIKLHLKTVAQKHFYQRLKTINEQESDCLDGKFAGFGSGNEHSEPEHPYSSDLDIFGKASLFQYLNRTTSHLGSSLLAAWLKVPASISEIQLRQNAVKELAQKVDFRQQMQAVGLKFDSATMNPQRIFDWLNQKPIFLNKNYLQLICLFLSLGLVVSFFVSAKIAFCIFVVNVLIAFKANSYVQKIHEQVSKNADILKSYSETIQLIENEDFKSERLQVLKQTFVSDQQTASQILHHLATILGRFDLRYNWLVHIPLNVLIFIDIHTVFSLEKWQSKNHTQIEKWFEAMQEFETLSSLSNFHFNNPDFVFPEIVENHFVLKAHQMGHPLILASKRCCNSFSIKDKSQIALVTGSNMSGKSTFLRTLGVNVVLALSGTVVCAKEFSISPVTVWTSMRIADSLEENISSFYAELKRLKTIIGTVEKKEKVLLLLDEILRGTNSNDRHIGSKALIKQLIKNEAVCILATHDLPLTEMSSEFPQHIENYNFDVQIANEELFFDYQIHRGICKSLNASILMKKMGINI